MNEDSTVVRLRQPEVVDDPLTEVLRAGARRLLAQAIEAEAEAFLAGMVDRRLADGRARFVRHGHGPERTIQTGIGSVAVQRVKVRDRAPAEGERRLRFTSRILPRWARRTRSLDALLPVLYLRGVSTGDSPRGARRSSWQEGAQPITLGCRPAQGRLAGRIRALAELARFVWTGFPA